jgi:hypothetical protein
VAPAAVVVRARLERVRAAAPAYGNRAAAAKAAVEDWVRADWERERAEVVAVVSVGEEPADQASVVEAELAVGVARVPELAAELAVVERE